MLYSILHIHLAYHSLTWSKIKTLHAYDWKLSTVLLSFPIFLVCGLLLSYVDNNIITHFVLCFKQSIIIWVFKNIKNYFIFTHWLLMQNKTIFGSILKQPFLFPPKRWKLWDFIRQVCGAISGNHELNCVPHTQPEIGYAFYFIWYHFALVWRSFNVSWIVGSDKEYF